MPHSWGRQWFVLQFCLQHFEDEYSAVVLTDVQKSLRVVETQACRTVQLAVGVEQFLRVAAVDCEHLDAVIAVVRDPDAVSGVDDERARLVELVWVGAGRRAVAVRHLLALAVDETDAVQWAAASISVTDDPDARVERHRAPRVLDR